MTIKQFAEQHTIRIKRDEDGEQVIIGRDCKKKIIRSHIYLHGASVFGAMCLFDSPRRWNKARNDAAAAGVTVHQNGDREGCLLFDPTDAAQSAFVIALIKARKKRKVSLEQVERMKKTGFGSESRRNA